MATNKRINVLVYTGEGTTSTSLHHVFQTFRLLLSPTYIVLSLSSSALLKEPWQPSCAALIMPGGADLPYCRTLNGPGNQKIKQFVENGGRYLGLCAGGYYGSARCEFMQGDKSMEVVGDRELAFFPGICRGLAFKGFRYQSEEGAKAVELSVHAQAFGRQDLPKTVKSYYNGGGVFVDAAKFEGEGVQVLASYKDKLDCDAGQSTAAVVYRKIGQGHVLLTGPHAEFAPVNLDKNGHGGKYKAEVEKLEADDDGRQAFLKACLEKIDLRVNSSSQPVPSLSPLHLSTYDSSLLASFLPQWKGLITNTGDAVLIQGDNDTFQLNNYPALLLPTKQEFEELESQLSSVRISTSDQEAEHSRGSDRVLAVDYDKITKHIYIHGDDDLPSIRDTPKFRHEVFYSNLEKYLGTRLNRSSFGKVLLYGEVVTSTSTLLEKNNSLLRTLPTGFTATASTQISGRGRGSNVWVSPPGSLMFSTVIWHPVTLAHSSPVVFIQYLAAMAVVCGTKTYGRGGYDKLPLRLKWPNDVYAEDPRRKGDYVKVGGILVNSTYSGEQYGLVVGVGVNVANAAPTTGLDELARSAGLPVFETEKLLARILTSFEELYSRFIQEGWGSWLESLYHDMWLHSEQVVTLECEGGQRARIKGISRDWGMLVAEELGWEDRPTGGTVELQSDSNSFDFFRGLVKRKT